MHTWKLYFKQPQLFLPNGRSIPWQPHLELLVAGGSNSPRLQSLSLNQNSDDKKANQKLWICQLALGNKPTSLLSPNHVSGT